MHHHIDNARVDCAINISESKILQEGGVTLCAALAAIVLVAPWVFVRISQLLLKKRKSGPAWVKTTKQEYIMGDYQGVGTQYLRADRATYLDTGPLIQFDEGINKEKKGHHWYSDRGALNFRGRAVRRCEIGYVDPYALPVAVNRAGAVG